MTRLTAACLLALLWPTAGLAVELHTTLTDSSAAGATADGTIGAEEYGAGATSGVGSGFGGVIGSGSTLAVESDGDGNVVFGLTGGGGTFNDMMVIYLDTGSGGFSTTGGFTDVGDEHRRAISGYDAPAGNTFRSELVFATGFEADYAIAFGRGFAGLWALDETSHLFVAPLAAAPADVPDAGAWEIPLALADVGLTAGDSFDYVVTYLNPMGVFRSNEFHGVAADTVGDVNPGQTTVSLAAGDFVRFVSFVERCGNGELDAGEECDDGGESAGCDADCTFVMCGDGTANATAGEACDPGVVDAQTLDLITGATSFTSIELDAVAAVAQTVTLDEAGTLESVSLFLDGYPTSCQYALLILVPVRDGALGTSITYGQLTDELAGEGPEWVTVDMDTWLPAGDYALIFYADWGSEGCVITTSEADVANEGHALEGSNQSDFDEFEWSTLEADLAVKLQLTPDPTGACNGDCTLAECGDGIVDSDGGETCDDGGTEGDDGCAANCTTEDGFVCYGAPSECQPLCGNGLVDDGEECDDEGESASCDDDCTLVACGDGVANRRAGESCDDGGESGTCNADCSTAWCGDGVVNETAGEACDGGSAALLDTNDDGGAFGTVQATMGLFSQTFTLTEETTLGAIGLRLRGEGGACSQASVSLTTVDEGGAPSQDAADVVATWALTPPSDIDDWYVFTLDAPVTLAAGQWALVGSDEGSCTWWGEGNGHDGGTSWIAGQFEGNVDLGLRLFGTDGTSVPNDECDGTCQLWVCGNGEVEGNEECDDGGESAGCDADCTFVMCGDGTTNATAGEACDTAGESATCDVDCTAAECGDGVTNPSAGEDCDTAGESATCDVDCTYVMCGDGTTNAAAGESCDDRGESATCDVDCTAAECGDGVTNPSAGEDCDTAGESATCDVDCTYVMCGDGTTNAAAGESCDDRGESATCDVDCTAAECGDGVTNASAGEDCDAAGESATCDADCTAAECGDGTTNAAAGEACDGAGETADCDGDCTAVACGDGTTNATAGEACDPGVVDTQILDLITGATSFTTIELDAVAAVAQTVTLDQAGTLESVSLLLDGYPTSCQYALLILVPERDGALGTSITYGQLTDELAGEGPEWVTVSLDTWLPAGDYALIFYADRGSEGCVITTSEADVANEGHALEGSNQSDFDEFEWSTLDADLAVKLQLTPDPTGACNGDCTLAECGDGIVDSDGGETCDDGGTEGDDGCAANCTTEDGFVCYGAPSECQPLCGNGLVDDGEECDDEGESASCDDDCTLVACGDGVANRRAGESCDDGGESGTCNADCSTAWCGDGVVNETAGEACDGGSAALLDTNDDGGAFGTVQATMGLFSQTFTLTEETTLGAIGLRLRGEGGACSQASVSLTTVDEGGAPSQDAADVVATWALTPPSDIDDWYVFTLDAPVTLAAGQWALVGSDEGSCTWWGEGNGHDGGTSWIAGQFEGNVDLGLRLFGTDGTAVPNDECDGTCQLWVCGNGEVEGNEECDDGGESAGCDADCTFVMCGDGTANAAAGEACDTAGESATCDVDCTAAECGDGVTNGAAGEACDTSGESATCDADCTAVECGDGTTNAAAGEACDTAGASATCDVDCTTAECGDGVTNGAAGEACDTSGESATCDADCTAVECGDGVANAAAGEACDTAGASATCDADCTAAECGDGTTNAVAGEACDTAGESATCDADCTAVACGDGVANAAAGEACDTAGESATCDADCTAVECGDGVANAAAGEACDTAGESATCDADCTAVVCGDGTTNAAAGEACDTAGESATCDADCTAAACGDGQTNAAAGEACDTAGESATCDADCTAVACGDGTTNAAAGEACDTAGESATCDADCTAAACGDGQTNAAAGETCDDAGESASCDADCTAVECGDGTANATAGEACDTAGESEACNADCTAAECGDGVVNGAAAEACDDLGQEPGDGCDAACRIEPGYVCAGEPSACAPTCGNGALDESETCDDANLDDGDGCSATCQTEDGWDCDAGTCAPVCGDGRLVADERCDDGASEDGDGCSASCALEAGAVVLSELHFGLDGAGEWLELLNTTNGLVDAGALELGGEPLSDCDGVGSFDAGERLVVALDAGGPDGAVRCTSLQLDAADPVVRADGVELDRVSFEELSCHLNHAVGDGVSRSLERPLPDAGWCLSDPTHTYDEAGAHAGSPGTEGSCAEAACDGEDDDCNGAIDDGLQDCSSPCEPTAELCTGDVDEDCDGLTDCADDDCSDAAACSTADVDADGDGVSDDDEVACGTDPDDAADTPTDSDGDGICDALDDDGPGDTPGDDGGSSGCSAEPGGTPPGSAGLLLLLVLLLAAVLVRVRKSGRHVRRLVPHPGWSQQPEIAGDA